MFDSVTFRALNSALDGLAARQRAIANNREHQHPRLQAQRVQFENALAESISRRDGFARATTETSLEPTRENGNNVNLDTETLSNIDTLLRYQFASNAMNGQFSSIRTAMRTA